MIDRSIFLEALEICSPEQRVAFLNEACGDDSKLRKRVEILLSAYEDAGSFLEKSPEELAATVGAEADIADEEDGEWSLEFLGPCDKPNRIGTLGPYEVIDVVGRGGMGIVLRAADPKLNRVVAIKVMAPELAANAMAVRRFLREAQAAAAVSHDHIVTIYAIDEENRPPFIALEFVDGPSLQ
jgi:serine/threonine protein kinase